MRKVNGHNMATNNFKVFNESKTNIMSDTDYGTHLQRKNGVVSGVAISALHNKLYRQTSIVAKAVADFIASQGLDATDNDSTLFSTNLAKALEKVTKVPLDGHRTQEILDHPDQSVTTEKVKDLAITEGKLAKDSVTEAKIKDLSVTTRKISDKSVTMGKVDNEVKGYLIDTYVKKSGDSIDGDLVFKGSKGSIYFNPNNSVSAKVYVNDNGTLDIGVNNSTNQSVDNISLCSMNKPKWYNKKSGSKALATEEDVTNAVAKKVSKAGDTMTGRLLFTEYNDIAFQNSSGGYHTIHKGGERGQNLDVGSTTETDKTILCCRTRPGWYRGEDTPSNSFFLTIPDISVTYGNIRDGQMLPIPEGFNENECTWLLSMDQSNPDRWYLDIREGGPCNMINFECWREGRKVHVGARYKGQDGLSQTYGSANHIGVDGSEIFIGGTANYVCIAVKKS